jgi:cell division protein FtsQ
VTPTQIEYAARSAVAGNFFTVNLDAVRAAFEKLPWVRKAEVRRRWPDGLELAIEEHVAAARWKQADAPPRRRRGAAGEPRGRGVRRRQQREACRCSSGRRDRRR